jgi:hypothetical protein
MASISSKGAKGHHTYKLTLTEASTSTANNTSTINYTFELIDDANWFWEQWSTNISYSISANGSVIKSGYIPNHTTKNQTIASGSFTVPHNADGSKSISYSFSVIDNANQYYTSGNASASGTMALTKIPRYAKITSFSVSKRDETSVIFISSTDATCDWAWYSKDNGVSWSDLPQNNIVTGLSANTTYNFKLRVRRKDSQLTTDSGTYSQTTYDYPKPTSLNHFTIGDGATVYLYNPLGRNCTLQIISKETWAVIGTYSGTYQGDVNGEFKTAEAINLQYMSIPNKQVGGYYARVLYGNIEKTLDWGGTYSIRGNETPTINSLSYIDNNSTTVALTGNNQHIVQNYSSLVARVGSATGNWYAGISKYVVECNGKSAQSTSSGNFSIGAVNSNRNVELKLTVTDTRGLTASKTITVTMLSHSTPNATVTLQRLNNYEDETYLTVDGSVSSVNGKNTMAIKYRYKQSGGSYGSYVNINDNQKYTFSLDKNNAYIFNVVVTDALGSTFNQEFVLDKGMFPLFIDTEKNSVGINCFPANEMSLEVNGLDISTIKEFTKTYKLTANTWTDTGIYYNHLATGTYIMQVVLNDATPQNAQYGERISGILTWYALPTNGTDADVIPVSKSGHSRNGHNIQLRVLRTSSSGEGVLKLQIMDDVAWNGNANVVFRFKRLI